MSCGICYERFTAPVSLPCGHVFCRECLRRTVDATKSCNVQHWCPACRAPYNVASIDPALVPPYLRPHVLPSIRPLFFDASPVVDATESQSQSQSQSHAAATHSPSASPLATSPASSASASSSQESFTSPPLLLPASPFGASLSPPPPRPADAVDTGAAHSDSHSHSPPHTESPLSELGRASAESAALRLSLATWRQRAEVHAAANAGLLSFGRAARAAALRMRAERDTLRSQNEILKRQVLEMMTTHGQLSVFPDAAAAAAGVGRAPAKRPLPAFLAQPPQQQALRAQRSAPVSESREQSLLGPPLKRRRLSSASSGSGSASSAESSPPLASPAAEMQTRTSGRRISVAALCATDARSASGALGCAGASFNEIRVQ